MSRTVVYAEVPCFYAAIERAANPSLRERPIVVGGDPRKRGLVVSATPDAQAAGVRAGMPMVEALQSCPEARALRTDMRRYRETALRLRACLARELPCVEPDGLAAAYLDGTGSEASIEQVVARLRARVRVELGLPLRVGVASARFLARLAAEEAGPDGMTRVPPGGERAFLHELPVGRLPGVGPRTEELLAGLGVATAGALAQLEGGRLEERLGNHGHVLHAMARGQGDDRVRAAWHRRSLSQESTFRDEQRDLTALEDKLLELARGLEEGLRLQGLAARRLILKLRYAGLGNATRSRTVRRGIRSAAEIHRMARELLSRSEAGTRPVKLVGLSLSSLEPETAEDRQLELFPPAD